MLFRSVCIDNRYQYDTHKWDHAHSEFTQINWNGILGEKRTSVFSNGLIWFGAGVSLAEILTGTYFAPLGFGKAMAAILLGHLIGGLMMFAAGMIGAKERKSAMETVKMSFCFRLIFSSSRFSLNSS